MHIGFPVADDKRAAEIETVALSILIDETGFRLAARAVVRRCVGTNEDLGERNPFALKNTQKLVLRLFKLLAWILRAAEGILVAYHHELKAAVGEQPQTFDDTGDKLELLERIDLFIRRFDDQRSIAVKKDDLLHERVLNAVRRASFCSGVPTEIRRHSVSFGSALRSRTMMPR